LAQRIFPRKGILREMLVVLSGAGLIALLAQVRIDIWPVPVTGQTLGVLLCGALLGFRRGVAASALYVGVGLAGLPVFAGSGAGLAVLTGTTGGYLVGFVVSAGTVGLLAEHGYLSSYGRTALAMVLGTLPVFVLGIAWLLNYVAPSVALHAGLVVFLPGAAIKIALATVIAARPGRTDS
jgi:biotin transport system substrate-specific component